MSEQDFRKAHIVWRYMRRLNRWFSAAIIIMVIDILAFKVCASSPIPVGAKDTVIVGGISADRVLQLLHCGANYAPFTWTGQYWRLLTSLFLHLNVVHVASNILFLLLLAVPIEHLYGREKVGVLYISSGLAGWLASMYWHPTVMAYGSSGAIDGLAGFLVPVIAFNKDRLSKRWAAMLLFVAVSAIVLTLTAGRHSKAVDNAAHVGGLCFGLILGGCFAWIARSKAFTRSATEWRTLTFATLALVGLFVVSIRVRSDIVELGRGERASENKDFIGAVPHLQRFVIRNPADLVGHSDLGYAYLNLNRNEEAVREYRRILEIEPDDAVAQYNLAWLYTLSDPDRAIPLYRASLPRLPRNPDRYYDFAIALRKAGNLEEAETVALKALSLDPHSELKQGLYIQIVLQRTQQRIASERAQQQRKE